MDCIEVVAHRYLTMSTNNDFSPIEGALQQVNIALRDENSNYKSCDNILSEVIESFEIMIQQNEEDYKRIKDKYVKEHEDYIEQIYCHDRDILEDKIKGKNIIMYNVCNKLAGIRNGISLYKYILTDYKRKHLLKTLN